MYFNIVRIILTSPDRDAAVCSIVPMGRSRYIVGPWNGVFPGPWVLRHLLGVGYQKTMAIPGAATASKQVQLFTDVLGFLLLVLVPQIAPWIDNQAAVCIMVFVDPLPEDRIGSFQNILQGRDGALPFGYT